MTPQVPPRFARWLLRALLPAGEHRDVVDGDLLEEFRFRSGGRAWYWRETLSIVIRYAWRARRAKGRTMSLRDTLRQDLRYAIRSFVKAPSFSAVVMATLAIGIGSSTAIFSIVNGILLRPLPFADPDRLLWINEVNKGRLQSVSWLNFEDWQARTHSFEVLAASVTITPTLTSPAAAAERLQGRRVTSGFFPALRVAPAIGRGFGPADDRAGAEPVAIVSQVFWQRRLHGDAAAIGTAITLDGRDFTVVGVLPPGFKYLRDYDVFVAIGPFRNAQPLTERGNHAGYYVLGRPRPGVSVDAATRELQQVETAVAREHPDTNSGLEVVVERLADRVVVNVRQTLWVLFGAVAFLLLLACINIANLLIARGVSRQRELAVRAALGGGRVRLATQLFVESAVIGGAGCACGIPLAFGLLKVLLAFAPDDTPRLSEVTVDGAALIFAAAATMVCAVLFGAFPALQASRSDGQQVVVRGRAGMTAASAQRLRRVLVMAQTALALVLLTTATLMMRTVQDLMRVDVGFDPAHLVSVKLSMRGDQFDGRKRTVLLDGAIGRVRALPGVRAAAAVSDLPMEGSTWNSVFVADGVPLPARREDLPSSAFTIVSPRYFETMGIALLRGRPIVEQDGGGTPVVVINETMARRLWPGQNPIGRRVKQGWPESPGRWREIVGVVHDVTIMGLTDPPKMQIYLPFAQEPPRDVAIVIRSAADVAGLVPAVESVVHGIAADVPVFEAERMEDVLASLASRERMATVVLGLFAVVALLLATVGLYGVVAHGVVERRQEIGIRMALGATASQILKLIVGGGLSIALVGAVLGVGGALAASRALKGLLYGVSATDPVSVGAVAAVLLAIAAGACFVPALRALRVPPSDALRM